MKRYFFFFTVLSALCMLTACASSALGALLYTDAPVPFKGTMEPDFGYEDFRWGMSPEDCKKLPGYPFVYLSTYSNGERSIQASYGKTYKDSLTNQNAIQKHSHGDIGSTSFYFFKNYLYAVEDVYKISKHPTLEELHARYGDFSEENRAHTFYSSEKVSAVYTNGNPDSLRISVMANGNVQVSVKDALLEKSLRNSNVSTYLANTKKGLIPNEWYILGYTDISEKVYHYIFLTVNTSGDKLIFYYKKNLQSPALSSLRAGFQPSNGIASGSYEIKSKDGIVEEKYDTLSISLKPLGLHYSIAYNNSGSARRILNLLLQNTSFAVRRNNTVMEFSGRDFSNVLADWGISMDELDVAIANEEF